TLSKSLIRQGTRVVVQVHVEIQIPGQVWVDYHDKYPKSCTSDPKDPQTDVLSSGHYSGSITYSVTPLIHGSFLFPGGTLSIRDPFFMLNLLLTSTEYTGPVLQVQPYPIFEGPGGSFSLGREMERIGPVQGFGVRMLRAYLPGDDLRHIDWKMSAKRGTMYIREYTNQEEGQVMLIVDLPDSDLPYDDIRFARMVSVVCGFIESSLFQKESISLLLISGPNFCDISLDGRDMAGFMSILREQLHPCSRMHHWYRKVSRSDLRARSHSVDWYRKTRTKIDAEGECMMYIKRLSERHLLQGGVSKFQARMARTIQRHRICDIMVYSLCEGDVSHIREIFAIADHRNIRFRVKVPGVDDFQGDHLRSMLRGIQVEDI
ncbi:MAG: DUF58 domain-containing protein, partial [Methanobacteriota archaeon]